MRDLGDYVQEELVRYQLLFDKPVQGNVTVFFTRRCSWSMGAFVQVTPLPVKVGDMAFLCVCADAYQSYTCVDAIGLSMLFNPDLNMQDNLEHAGQLAREAVEGS